MNENGVSKLNQMTSTEIAEAVDARKYWRGLHHRILCIARSGAFTWFLFQYLLFFRLDLLWTIVIVAFALVVELRTNRFTMTTYSTSEIVDLLMKRASLNRTKYGKRLAAGPLLWVASLVACSAGAPLHMCHAGLFFGAALLVWTMKCADQIRNEMTGFFHFTRSDQGGFHVRLQPSERTEFLAVREHSVLSLAMRASIYVGMALGPFVAVVFFLFGGIDTLSDGQEQFFLLSVVLSLIGCISHEPARFYLVQRELDRLEETGRPGVRNGDGA